MGSGSNNFPFESKKGSMVANRLPSLLGLMLWTDLSPMLTRLFPGSPKYTGTSSNQINLDSHYYYY
jgi:hypothetical protein